MNVESVKCADCGAGKGEPCRNRMGSPRRTPCDGRMQFAKERERKYKTIEGAVIVVLIIVLLIGLVRFNIFAIRGFFEVFGSPNLIPGIGS